MLTLEGGINDSLFENNESAHRGGAVYVNTLKGGINNSVFKSNLAYGAADAEKSGIGGALSLRGNVEINGGAFINNSADTSNIGDLSSGRGGAIFYDAVYDDDKFTLSAADAANSLYFSGNTHNVGGAGATGNSIYFGATALYENLTQGHVDFNLNAAQNAQIVMLDAMASQQDGLQDGDGNAYSNLTVDVTKSGQGTWILAGHNDMRAAGHWLIDEGTLQFAGMADGINRPVHIDLQHSDSSFTLSSGAGLLVTLETDRHIITAGEITLAEGSYVDLARSINYGHVADVLHDDYIVLSLQSDSVQNQSQTGSGTVKVGIYDYAYALHWDGNDLIFNHSQTGAYNHDRAGDAAITAPGVIAFYNPINNELGYRTGDRFRNLNGTRALNNLWATPTYSVVSQHTGGNRVGYDLKTTGMAAGYDFPLGERAFIGVAFSVSRPDYQSRAAKYQGVDATGVIYGGVVLPYNVELSLFGGYGVTDSNLVRKVEGVKYHTDVEFNTWRAGVELGRRFELTPRFSVRPFASYEYFNVDVEGYNEGQGVYNLKVDDYRQEFQRAKIGAELGYVHAESGAYVNMQAYYARNFDDLKARADIAFTQDLATKYKAVGNPLDKDVIGAGISAGIPLTEKIDLMGSYTFEYGKEAVSQQVGLNLVFRF